MTTKNKSQQIREYVAANPQAKPREVATALKIAPAYVHTAMWVAKNKAEKAKAEKAKARKPTWKTVAIQSSGESVKDNVTNLTSNALAELTYVIANGRAKQRAQSIGGDAVEHPAHYKVGGIETIDFIEAKELNYNLGNVVKYITRADHKGNKLEDLRKAQWYLQREINALKQAA